MSIMKYNETVAPLGIVLTRGSLRSSPRPLLVFSENGEVRCADVGSGVWEALTEDRRGWKKEAHQAEYIVDRNDTIDDAIEEIEEYGRFDHLKPMEWPDARTHDDFQRRAEMFQMAHGEE